MTDWKDNLRMQMENYGETAPESTENAVFAAARRAALRADSAAAASMAAARRRRRIGAGVASFACVAAAVALVFVLRPSAPPAQPSQSALALNEEPHPQIMEEQPDVEEIQVHEHTVPRKVQPVPKSESVQEQQTPVPEPVQEEPEHSAAIGSTESTAEQSVPANEITWQEYEKSLIADAGATQKRSRSRVSIGFNASGGAAGVSNGTVAAMGMHTFEVAGSTIYTEEKTKATPEGNTILVSSGMGSVDSETRFYQPISVGFSVAWNISSRLALESGLTYSVFRSEESIGAGGNTQETVQNLHFIGLHLRLRFNFWQASLWNVYATAGAEMQKCLGGRLTTSYITDGASLSETSGRVRIVPLFWSLNASLGLSYDISRRFCVYLEPGINWYLTAPAGFSGEGMLPPVDAENPISFRFAIGARLNL